MCFSPATDTISQNLCIYLLALLSLAYSSDLICSSSLLNLCLYIANRSLASLLCTCLSATETNALDGYEATGNAKAESFTGYETRVMRKYYFGS